jgi:hypothetical protein
LYYFWYPIYKCMIFLVTHYKLAHNDFIFHCSVVSYYILEQMKIMQRKLLRQLQGLSNQVAHTAVYVLIGAVTIYMIIERNMLSLLMNIIRNNTTVEYKIIMRQLAMRNEKDHAFINRIPEVIQKYNLDNYHVYCYRSN